MTFGEKVRAARKAKALDLRTLAEKVGVHFTYLSKVENGRLDFGDAPGEQLIRRLAETLDLDTDELLLLARKIPEAIRQRVLERPDAFRQLAALDDAALDRLLTKLPKK
jgi:transcriptional regulator with XRE-family HTH domain